MLDYETRKEMIKAVLVEKLEINDDLFIEACEELDSWNGYLNDDRCYEMNEIDDILYGKKPSEIIDMIDGTFDSSCEWFYFSIYGLESCSSKIDHYKDVVSSNELLEDLISNYANISELTSDSDFDIALEMLYDDDESAIMEDDDETFKHGLELLAE